MWKENPCGMLIRQLHLSLSKESDKQLRAHGLTMPQIMVLLYLSDASGQELSLKELERLMQVSQPDVAGIIARLDRKGMVQSYQDPTDKRMKRVRLTPQGEHRCTEARGNMTALEKSLLSGMTEEECAMFRALLEKANRNF